MSLSNLGINSPLAFIKSNKNIIKKYIYIILYLFRRFLDLDTVANPRPPRLWWFLFGSLGWHTLRDQWNNCCPHLGHCRCTVWNLRWERTGSRWWERYLCRLEGSDLMPFWLSFWSILFKFTPGFAPRIIVFFLVPFLQTYFETVSTPPPWWSNVQRRKRTLWNHFKIKSGAKFPSKETHPWPDVWKYWNLYSLHVQFVGDEE